MLALLPTQGKWCFPEGVVEMLGGRGITLLVPVSRLGEWKTLC